ncbi:MAG: 16S rRNA (uracil(1498)-N(3))-methyltransferase, partial [Deltaproteobacteria bacterium]|nr:16S rRNA (uracil(1498)-N(3))-methyltransferase [Deltaproteobacteria bacterium]
MRRFFVHKPAIASDKATITGSDVKHIRTVLRLKPGDRIVLVDGRGSEYLARINESTSRAVTVSILDTRVAAPEPGVELAIGMAMVKAGKMDRIVRQLTELGVAAFLPFVAERSVPRPNADRAAKKRQRWQAIAKEAVKQCGRLHAPRVAPLVSYEQVLKASAAY